jgi:hypothetical protein
MISKPHDIFSIFSLLFDFDMLIEARKDRRRLIGKIERCEQQQQKHGAHSRFSPVAWVSACSAGDISP